MNKVILIGRLGKDPEVKTIQTGTSVATFSVATSEFYKDANGNKKEITDWHNIVAWGGLADIAGKYLKKGARVALEGKNRTRSWESGGTKHYTTEVIADRIELMGDIKESKPKPMNEQEQRQHIQDTGLKPDDSATDDLPF